MTLLQYGPDIGDYLDGGLNGLLDAIFSDYFSSVDAGLFGLLVGGVVLYASWQASPTQSMALPAVLCVLFGSSLGAILPGQYAGMILPIIIIGLAAGFLSIANRWVNTGGTIQ